VAVSMRVTSEPYRGADVRVLLESYTIHVYR
jgi:hypothetical protein